MTLNFKKIFISVLLSLCLFILAFPAQAQGIWEKIKPPEVETMAPVPGGESLAPLIVGVVTWLMGVIGAIAVGFIVWGAWTYVMSAGNEKKIEEAKRIILYAILGFVIAILAVVIVQTIGGAVGGGYICKCNNCKQKFPFSTEEECDTNCNSRCDGVCGSGGGECVSAEEAAGEERLCEIKYSDRECLWAGKDIPSECWDSEKRRCRNCTGYDCIETKACDGKWCCGNIPEYCCCKSTE